MQADLVDSIEFTVCVCTYNSAETLPACLASVRRFVPGSRLLVVDHCSQDATREIAEGFEARIFKESKGLGFARQLCFDLTKTKYLVFVDGDVEIVSSAFFALAVEVLRDERFGAIVGMAVGHRFQYGLPASLLVLRKTDFEGKVVPEYIDARETFFIQRRLDDKELRTYYVTDAMVHRSRFRKFKPEWEGANTRLLPDSKLRQLLFILKVVLLLSLNSGKLKNILYVPVFYFKFMCGFVKPKTWTRMERDVNGVP